MKRLVFTLTSILILQISFAQWQEIDYIPTNKMIYDMASPNGQNIYIVGEEGSILHTSDLGQSWNIIPVDSSKEVFAIDFFDPVHGYYIDQDGFVYFSDDSGQSWVPHGYNPFIENLPKNFVMIDSLIGYSSDSYAVCRITKTTDGGISWELLDSSQYLIEDFQFINKDTGWIASTQYLFKTTNGGQTTDTISIDGTVEIDPLSLFFLDSDNGWISAHYNTLYKTNNGGATWTVISNQATFDRMYFSDTLNGFGLDNEICFITNDGGYNWQRSNLHNGIFNIEPIDNNYWIYCLSGKISISPDLNDYTSIGTNFHVGFFWDLMILNDSVHCIADANSSHLVFTENDGESYKDIALTGINGHPNCNVVWLESREIIWAGTDDGRLLKTTDGGNNWIVQVDLQNENYSFLELEFTDNLHSWAIYRLNTGGHWIIRTVDGWQSWNIYEIGPSSTPSCMQFVDSLHGWYCEINGHVHRTIDGGVQWNSVHIPGYLTNIQFLNSQVGYAYSNYYYKTIDGGITWDTITIPDNGLDDGFFLNEDTGWVMSSHEIWHTKDGGLNWINQLSAVDIGNSEIEFLNKNYGILIRSDGPYDSQLFKTYNGGATWIETENNSDESTFSIYPNPAKETLSISSPIILKEVEIFDISGCLVRKILVKEKQATSDISDLPPGIYLLRGTSGSKYFVKRFVKI
jgi:photosystem II stability/assembly factor-like uncharacterized protein